MCGDDQLPDSMFCYVSTEQRIPLDHPLRAIRALVDQAFGLEPELPWHLRSERALAEQAKAKAEAAAQREQMVVRG
jgi:hypothetical protein